MRQRARREAVTGAAGAARTWNVFTRFILVLLGALSLLVLVLSYEFGRVLRQEMLELQGRVTAGHVRRLAEREFPSEAELSAAARDASRARFRALEREIAGIPEMIRIKVWDTGSRVVYSDEPKLIGMVFPDNRELARALAGAVEVEIGQLKSEHVYEVGRAPERRLLEVYVPLGADSGGRAYGVVEVYTYSPSFFAHMDAARLNLWVLSLAGGAGIFLAIGGIFWGAWRKERDLSRQLEAARRFNEDIIENVETGILVLDRSLTVLSWNRAMEKLCGGGIAREGVLGRNFCDLFPCLSQHNLRSRLAEAARTGRPYWSYARPCPICEKESVIVNTRVVPINDETGRPSKILITIENVTEVRRLEAQVIQSEKLATIGEMYASLTHEINNPLGIIVSKVKTLLAEGRQAGDRPGLIKDFEQIERQSGRIAEIVRNLLTFARKAAFEKKPVDLNRLIVETLALIQKPFAKSNIRVVSALQPDLPPVSGDPNLLQQVLMNLLSNAKDAMPRGGQVWIRSRRAEEESAVVVEVEDEGIGIGADIIDKVFHPFFTTKEVGKGTGLGLSVSYGIVRSHGGELRVKSREGAGALFSIVLPPQGQEG